MTNSEVMDIMHAGLLVTLKLGGPILLLSMAIGVLVSIFQAATQINEQTLTFVPKLVIIGAITFIFGSWMLETLKDFTYEIFKLMI